MPVERLDYYVPGGYHPVQIGHEFHNGRYVIVHKLGFGRSATTWLAEDKQDSRLVALKISTAESAEHTVHESQVLTWLTQAKSQPGKAEVQTLLDSFSFLGPNGGHQCLVMDAARVNINEAKEAAYHRLIHLPAARAIVAQLVLGVEFIHSQVIVHGEIIVPLWLGLGSDEITLTDSSILITDFGEAFDPSLTKTFTCHTPHLLAPPEAFFAGPETDNHISFPADIWTLACTIWDVLGSAPPFEVFIPDLDSVTREHVETFGRLPDRWWGKWANRNNWFDEDGSKNVKEELRQLYSNSARGWDQRFPECIRGARRRVSKAEKTNFEVFDQDEEKAFGDMIKSMLVLEPGQRATIVDVVRCEWMQRWGLPELQRMKEKVREEETPFLLGISS
ncbi:hypothetical protein ASPCADRAFT_128340 [Aspergillus carbonarius ITEM 5010]|uniref:non-specific serine/threonine protein kinase n=1 Tax=Aspergillus carbonarius (strain ITEM 5010) TaxID=602072 RepID=A0A1R3RUL7_ASPC5|nr:hypothetical protein ASPCADRAFT_128340 [Aspergillus carbonarius ITEM 5010]